MTKIHTPGAPYEPIALPDSLGVETHDSLSAIQTFQKTMSKRHTVRRFAPTAVPRAVIETAILTAGGAPSGANHQPWHFCAIGNPDIKKRIREEAETLEKTFYEGRGGEDWIDDLSALGTDPDKSYLEIAPWLIVVFAERYGRDEAGGRYKNYYVQESVGIACGFLIAALHHAGLATLTYTPAPMGFLADLCDRPENEKPYMVLVTGYPADNAVIPKKSTVKKSLGEIATFFDV